MHWTNQFSNKSFNALPTKQIILNENILCALVSLLRYFANFHAPGYLVQKSPCTLIDTPTCCQCRKPECHLHKKLLFSLKTAVCSGYTIYIQTMQHSAQLRTNTVEIKFPFHLNSCLEIGTFFLFKCSSDSPSVLHLECK